MAREIVKKAGAAAVESALRSAMPWLEDNFTALKSDLRTLRQEFRDEIRALRQEFHNEIRALDAKVDALREEMLERFERHLHTMNEVSHRVTRLDGKLEGYTEAMRDRLLTDQRPGRKKRAG